jgi:hypothetical protein
MGGSDVQFALRLEPVVPIVSVFGATLEIQFVGAARNRVARQRGDGVLRLNVFASSTRRRHSLFLFR